MRCKKNAFSKTLVTLISPTFEFIYFLRKKSQDKPTPISHLAPPQLNTSNKKHSNPPNQHR